MGNISAEEAIDRICIEFEDECLNNNRPDIDEYLKKAAPEYRNDLIRELLPIELTYLPEETLSNSGQSYSERFPEHVDLINESLHRRAQRSGASAEQVTTIGRYDIIRRIGSGGFGVVFEGFDGQLQRNVAIKVSREKWERNEARVKKALDEARFLAGLNHPNILPVFDAGTCDQHGFYLVTALIDGISLSDYQRANEVDQRRAIDIVCRIADALKHAHDRQVIHRDVKPKNIMLDQTGNPFLVDFGLAIDATNNIAGPGLVGTPRYMSPEQARGESHRVDQTADLYSLGVVLSELLTNPRSLQDTISVNTSLEVSATPEHLVSEQLPVEVRRICLRATAERAADRYQDAGVLARDLRDAMESLGQEDSSEIPEFVPRGLRSFEPSDARFFQKLLPGPYDMRGMPASLSRLCERLDSRTASESVPVAVVLGPSGSGKSSLVKAGVLPLLPRRVATAFLDASLPNLNRQLIATMASAVGSSLDGTIPEVFASIRNGEVIPSNRKLLVVIDHFESWLNGQPQFEHSPLAAAMRQCDGRRVQFLLVCRDDCYTALTRLMRFLEVPLVEGQSSHSIVPFDIPHTASVLSAYGHAYGNVIATEGLDQQKQFVNSVSTQLVEDGAVVPIRVAVIAAALKNQSWSVETLKQLGGVPGVITGFVKSCLEGPNPHSLLSKNQDVVCSVFESLTARSDNGMRLPVAALSDLRSSCQGKLEDSDFDQLMTVLERELCLITQTGNLPTETNEPSFQLAHDFLTDPVRSWLRSHQLRTVAGRANWRLRERSEIWQQDPSTRSLPSAVEYVSFAMFTDRQKWNRNVELMMTTAKKQLFRKWSKLLVGFSCLLMLAGYLGYRVNHAARQELVLKKAHSDLRSAMTSSPRSAQREIESFVDSTPPDVRNQLVDALRIKVESSLAKAKAAKDAWLATGDESVFTIDNRIDASEVFRYHQIQAALGKPDVKYLLKTAIYLSEEQFGLRNDELHTDEFLNVITALEGVPKAEISEAIQEEFLVAERNGDVLKRPGLGKRRARLGIIGMYSGCPELAEAICDRRKFFKSVDEFGLFGQDEAGPLIKKINASYHDDMRTQFLFQSAWLRGNPMTVFELMEKTKNIDFKTCLVDLFAMLGSVSVPDETEYQGVLASLREICESRAPARLVAAAQHTVRRWDRTREIDDQALIECDECTVTPVGNIMIQCRSLNADMIKIIADADLFLWASKTETTNGQYRQFLMDPDTPPHVATDSLDYFNRKPDLPVGNVSLIGAMLYCNWLSAAENLEPCYDFEFSTTDPEKVLVTNGNNGYRLPTSQEWNRLAGHCSKPVQIMQIYAWTAENAGAGDGLQIPKVQRRIPNLNGLSDMFGSVREWTVSPHPTWNTGKVENAILMGGAITETRHTMGDARWYIHPKMNEEEIPRIDKGIGFRVVRNGSRDELVMNESAEK